MGKRMRRSGKGQRSIVSSRGDDERLRELVAQEVKAALQQIGINTNGISTSGITRPQSPIVTQNQSPNGSFPTGVRVYGAVQPTQNQSAFMTLANRGASVIDQAWQNAQRYGSMYQQSMQRGAIGADAKLEMLQSVAEKIPGIGHVAGGIVQAARTGFQAATKYYSDRQAVSASQMRAQDRMQAAFGDRWVSPELAKRQREEIGSQVEAGLDPWTRAKRLGGNDTVGYAANLLPGLGPIVGAKLKTMAAETERGIQEEKERRVDAEAGRVEKLKSVPYASRMGFDFQGILGNSSLSDSEKQERLNKFALEKQAQIKYEADQFVEQQMSQDGRFNTATTSTAVLRDQEESLRSEYLDKKLKKVEEEMRARLEVVRKLYDSPQAKERLHAAQQEYDFKMRERKSRHAVVWND